MAKQSKPQTTTRAKAAAITRALNTLSAEYFEEGRLGESYCVKGCVGFLSDDSKARLFDILQRAKAST